MAIQKQINYQVNFQANTANVQNALTNLQNSLRTIQATPIAFDSTGLVAAKQNAQELQVILQKATNVNTGKLDIGKFSQQLKASGKDLATYANSLKQLGSQGQQAFMQLAQSIGQAHVPLRTTNKLLNSLWINLKNVAKWQISSNLLMGFTSGISNAVQYTKDLNKNLNDIRIVSGQSADQMERFAEKANKAAKALSSSTNEYTKAALIYYQQGLNDQQVKERTDATIKMANVTGEAADDVSSYMTAIWNNFDNGSKSLEYYADVMTALGAATASSTDEIATGLEKFAGIAETVGLSYEYATSALATLVAETRQSPETVGTALKTIFSRLQGLKLGETLDDGTDLNKYSKALATVGVDIKESNGSLKDMDKILEELASKWNLIGKDQQMALAQTVGGVRQYTQLITLMDNWGDMQKNLDVAYGSEGELNKQAEIYAESWEAASERTRASLEKLYSDLVPEEFLIDFTNTMGGFVDAVDGVVEGIGGLGPILIMTLGMVASKLMPQILQGGQNIVSNMSIALGFGEKQTQNFIQQSQEILKKEGFLQSESTIYSQMLVNTQKILELRQYELTNSKNLTAARKEEINAQIEQLNNENAILMAIERRNRELQRQQDDNEVSGILYANRHGTGDINDVHRVETDLSQNAEFSRHLNNLGPANDSSISSVGGVFDKQVAGKFMQNQIKNYEEAIKTSYNMTDEEFNTLASDYDNINQQKIQAQTRFDTQKQKLIEAGVKIDENGNIGKVTNITKEQKSLITQYNKSKQAIEEATQAEQKYLEVLKQSDDTKKKSVIITRQMKNGIDQEGNSVDDTADSWNEYNNELRENADTALNESRRNAAAIVGDDVVQDIERTSRDRADNKRPFVENKTPEQIDAENQQAFNEAKAEQADGYRQAVQGVTSALSGAYMAIQSIQSLGSIWSNDDLTAGEKLLSTLMSISMIIPGITSTISGAKAVQEGWNKAKQASIILGNKSLLVTTATITAENGEIISTEGMTAAEIKETMAKTGNTVVTKINTAETWKNIAVKLASIAPYVLLAAAVGGLVYALVKAVTAESQEEQALKRAQAGLEESTKAYDKAKQKAEEFKNSIGEYDKGIAALTELKEGTEEYNKALEESNERAKDLIETHGLFDSYIIKGGVITINSDALDNIQNELEQEVNNAENVKNMSQIGVTNASLAVQRAKTIEDFGYIRTYKDYNEETQAYDKTRVEQEDFKTDYNRSLSDNEFNNIVEVLQKLEQEGPKTEAEKIAYLNEHLGESFQGLEDEILNSKDKFLEFAASSEKATQANEYYAREILKNYVEEEYSDEIDLTFLGKEDLKDNAMAALTTRLQKADAAREDGIVKELTTKTEDINKITSTGDLKDYINTNFADDKKEILEGLGMKETDFDVSDNKNLALTYAQLKYGYTDRSSLSYKGGNGVGKITNADGEVVFEDMSDEVMRREIAKMMTEQQIRENFKRDGQTDAEAEKTIKALDKLTDSTTKLDEELGIDFSSIMLDAVANEGQIDYTALLQQLGPTAKETLGKMSPKELMAFLGITEEQLKDLGFGSADEFQKGWKEAFEDFSTDDYFENKKATTSGKDRARVIQFEKEYTKALGDRNKAQKELDEAIKNGDKEAEKRARAELEAADAQIKASEDAYNQYVKEQEIIENIQTKLNNLRENEEVEAAYKKIMENPDSNSEATQEAYGIMAGFIGAEFGIDLSAEEAKARWNEIKPLLDAEELEWGQIQQILYNIQAPDNFEEFEGQINSLEESTNLTQGKLETLYSIIKNFDPNVDGFDTLLTSLTETLGPAAALEYTLKNLKNVVPENLMTTYTIFTQVKEMKKDTLSNSAWGLVSDVDTTTTAIERTPEAEAALAAVGITAYTTDTFKATGVTLKGKQAQQSFVEQSTVAFYGKDSEGNKTIEFASEAAANKFLAALQEKMAEEGNSNQHTLTIVTENKIGDNKNDNLDSGAYEDFGYTDYIKLLAPIDEELEKQKEKVEDLSEAWENAAYYANSYIEAINSNINPEDYLISNENYKAFDYDKFFESSGFNTYVAKNTKAIENEQKKVANIENYQSSLKEEILNQGIKNDKDEIQKEETQKLLEQLGFNSELINSTGHQETVLLNFDKYLQNLYNTTMKPILDRQVKDKDGNLTFANNTDQKTYEANKKIYDSYKKYYQSLEAGFNQMNDLESQRKTSLDNIEESNKAFDESYKSAIEAGFTFDQRWNELAQAQVEVLKSKFSEEDFSDEAMNIREQARKKDLEILEDTRIDIAEKIAQWEAIPFEKRTADWGNTYNAYLKEQEEAEAATLQKRRDNTTEALDDIINKYEQFNSKFDNLMTDYENFLSATEDFALFNTNGEVNDTYAKRTAANIELVEIAQKRLTNAQSAYNEVMKKAKEDGVITNDEQIKLEEAKNILLEEEANLVDTIKSAYEELTNILEKYNDEIDRNKEKLDAITEITETYISILETLGERFNIGNIQQPEAMQKLQKASLDMAIKNVKVVKEQRDAQKEIVNQLEAELDKYEEGTIQYNQLLAIRNEEGSKLIELEKELATIMSESITQATEFYEANIQRILQTMKDAIAGENFSNLDDLQTAYDRAEKSAKRYLNTEQQVYELSKMRRSINKEISNTTSELANQKLRDILEDINKIEADNLKMSEYDLKMLNAKYELYKAQIALEEAQNNKSQIRLQRNASGNWSYVFTADQGKIDEAAQKVEDAQYNIYSQSEQYLETIQKNILTLQKEWTSALEEIYKDATLSEEERIAKIDQTNNYYANQLQYYTTELNKTLDVTGLKFEDTSLALITGFNSIDEIANVTTKNIISSLNDLEEELENYENVIDEAMENADLDLNTFGNTVAELAGDGKNSVVKNFDTIATSIEKACSTISEVISPILKKLQELANIDLSNITELPNTDEVHDTNIISKEDKNKYSNVTYDTDTDYSLVIEEALNDWNNSNKSGNAWNKAMNKAKKANNQRNSKIINENLPYNIITPEELEKAFKEGKLPQFDTGGYTGEWGSEGRLAVLHQKEIVLNKDDTQRILNAVEIARMIAGNALGQMGSLANAFSLASYQSNPQTLQQEVHIEATFPGVQSAFEIETALKNIVNDVSQYAEMPNKFN